jgi:hypothetical protein
MASASRGHVSVPKRQRLLRTNLHRTVGFPVLIDRRGIRNPWAGALGRPPTFVRNRGGSV